MPSIWSEQNQNEWDVAVLNSSVEIMVRTVNNIRNQVCVNVNHAKDHAPEGPIIDGKRTAGILHSQEVLAGPVYDMLNNLELQLFNLKK